MANMDDQQRAALVAKIEKLRTEAGLSQSALSRKAGISSNFVHNLVSGKVNSPRHANIIALAKALGVPANDLLMAGSEPLGDPVPVDTAAIAGWPRDLPVYASAVLADDPEGGMTIDEGEVVNWAARSPMLAGIAKAYAVFIPDERMAPVYPEGDIVVLHPGRPARAGDIVLARVTGADGRERAYLRYLDAKDGGGVTLRDMDGGRMTIEKGAVKAIHRALSLTEVLGV